MVNVNDVYADKFLKADDLKGQEVTVTISAAEVEELGQTKDRRLTLYFQGKGKGMVCNKTNARRIAFAYGPDTDGWVGKSIVLYPEMVDFQGKPTWAIRVKLPASVMKQMATPVPAGGYNEMNPPPPTDSDIPF